MRRVLLVYSSMDPAGELLARELIEHYGMERVSNDTYHAGEIVLKVLTDRDIIYADRVDAGLGFKPEAVVFLSRHSSEARVKTLSVHVSGNPADEARYGGRPMALAPAHPVLMKSVLHYAVEEAERAGLKEYSVTMEVTHHGPTDIDTPSLFVEIGSTIDEWRDERAARVLASALVSALERPVGGVPAAGFGGPHYAPTFTRYMLETRYAVGHIISKYVIERAPDEVIREALAKSMGASEALIDWKGLRGGVRQRVKSVVESVGARVVKI